MKGLLARLGRALLGVLTDILVEGRKQGKWSADGTSAARPLVGYHRTEVNMFNRYAPLVSSAFLSVVAILRFLGQNEAADATQAAGDSAVLAYTAGAAAVATIYGVARKLYKLATCATCS